jgi:hypothetical protein
VGEVEVREVVCVVDVGEAVEIGDQKRKQQK